MQKKLEDCFEKNKKYFLVKISKYYNTYKIGIFNLLKADE